MNRLVFLTILIISSLNLPASAQIQITLDDFSERGGSRVTGATHFVDIQSAADDAQLQALGNASGANQVWDMSGFTFENDPGPIDYFVEIFDPAAMSHPGHDVAGFQAANCVLVTPDSISGFGFDGYTYFTVSSASVIGRGTLLMGAINLQGVSDPGDLQLDFPMEFGKTIQSDFTVRQTGPINANTLHSVTQVIDGWGTLKTPWGEEPALRIMRTETVQGQPFDEVDVSFITESQARHDANIGWDPVLNRWSSLGVTVSTISAGGGELCGGGISTATGVLLVVADASDLNASDIAIRDMLISLSLTVEIKSDETASTDDANGRDMIVISGSVDPDQIAADWSSAAIPVVSLDSGFYDNLGMTGSTEGTNFGLTGAFDTINISNAAHPIANGYTGDAMVLNSTAAMNWGLPGSGAETVASAGSQSVLFTNETGSAMEAGDAPARRAAFFMDDGAAAIASSDGLLLLKHTFLWGLGREGEITTNVSAENDQFPESFSLDQNYPNPFNPSTMIPFTLKESGHARLGVYNVMGQELGLLINRNLSAGKHSVEFDASALPSGIYLYRLDLDGAQSQRQMILQK